MSKENRVSDERLAEIAERLDRKQFAKAMPDNWPEVLISRADAAYLDDTEGTRDVLWATAYYLRSKPVAGVEVKPLEWKDGWGCSTAKSCVGVYQVKSRPSDSAVDVTLANGASVWSTWASVAEKGKAAAEADYRQRIMSAITYSVEHVASGQSYDAISKVVHECRNRQRQTGESDQMLSRWITEALSALLPKATAPVVSEPVFPITRKDGGEPCGECHLPEGEACDICGAFASPQPQPKAVTEERYRHKKRGTEYVLIGVGKMQTETWEQRTPGFAIHIPMSVDMREITIYRSAADPNEIWVRPREEFEDGRFEKVESSNG